MRIDDCLYFAPSIRFEDVDWEGSALLPKQFERRIEGFYIGPAIECAKSDFGFAAGALLVCCLDALARIRFGNGRHFTSLAKELHGFSAYLAGRFYREFRNGLVHEGRIKKGGQFCLGIVETPIEEREGILLVDPKLLADGLRCWLGQYVARTEGDARERKMLAQSLRRDFRTEYVRFASAK